MSFLKSKSAPSSEAHGPSDLGIAYSTKKAASRKKMAKGGSVPTPEDYNDKPDKGFGRIIFKAEGGMIDDEQEMEEHASMAAAIMSRRERDKMMAEGGMVDLDENAMEEVGEYEERNEAALKENYDEDLHSASQPEDSNEHGDEIEADKHDRVSAIRRKMKTRA